MEYLINPWYVYLMEVVEPIKVLSGIASSVGTVTSIILLLCFVGCDEDDEDYCKLLKTLKISLFITLLTFCLFTLIPSKEAFIQIYIASLTTPENLQTIKDLGVSLTEFLKGNLLDIIKEVKK